MLFMPFNFLIVWLVGLLSIGVLGGGIYILYEWYERELVGISYLIGGSAMVLLAGLILVDTTYTNPVKTSIFSGLLRKLQKPLLEPLLYLTILLSPIFWLMTWLSYLNGSLYISVEISGFTGTETRGQLNFAALLSALASPGVLARGTLAMFNYDATRTLGTINVPALVICGASDIATLPSASMRMKAEIPQAELVTLQPGGHMGLMEQNQQFAEAVSTFSAACS